MAKAKADKGKEKAAKAARNARGYDEVAITDAYFRVEALVAEGKTTKQIVAETGIKDRKVRSYRWHLSRGVMPRGADHGREMRSLTAGWLATATLFVCVPSIDRRIADAEGIVRLALARRHDPPSNRWSPGRVPYRLGFPDRFGGMVSRTFQGKVGEFASDLARSAIVTQFSLGDGV